MEKEENKIVPEWEDYYKTLENIRKSSIVNMFGAAPILAEYEDIDIKLARKVLSSWMQNYNALNQKYGWQ